MIKILGILGVCMSNSKQVDDEFDDLNRKLKIESNDFIATFFDLARIDDDKLRLCNLLVLGRNLIRDYEKDGTFENLPIFLENLAAFVRTENGL